MAKRYLDLRTCKIAAGAMWSCEEEGLVFVFSTEGQAKHHLSGKPIQKGDVLLLASAGAKLEAVTVLSFAWFALRLEHVYPLFDARELCRLRELEADLKTGCFFPANSPVALECHRLIQSLPSDCTLIHRSFLLQVAAITLSRPLRRNPVDTRVEAGPEQRIFRALEKLSHEEIVNLSVEDMAQRLHCSRRHLNRLFRQAFGQSVSAFRLEVRLLRAAALLREPGVKVISVAQECGFNQVGAFNLQFKRRFQMSPGRWRDELACAGEETECTDPKQATACRFARLGLCARQPDAPPVNEHVGLVAPKTSPQATGRFSSTTEALRKVITV